MSFQPVGTFTWRTDAGAVFKVEQQPILEFWIAEGKTVIILPGTMNGADSTVRRSTGPCLRPAKPHPKAKGLPA